MALVLDGTLGVPVTTVTGTLPVANGGTGGSTSTGTGAVVLASSPSLTNPAPGTPASGVLTNCTGAVVASLSTASGSAPSYSARAWVKFNGTGTVAITASGNVSSITDRAVGKYTVNFTTAMSDANYCSQANVQKGDASDDGQVQAQAGGAVGAEQTAGAMPVIVLVNVTLTDSPAVFAVAFR